MKFATECFLCKAPLPELPAPIKRILETMKPGQTQREYRCEPCNFNNLWSVLDIAGEPSLLTSETVMEALQGGAVIKVAEPDEKTFH